MKTAAKRYVESISFNACFIGEQLQKRNDELYKEICSYSKAVLGEINTIKRLLDEKYLVEKILFNFKSYKDGLNQS